MLRYGRVAQATRAVMRRARVRAAREAASLGTGGGAPGVFPALAADVAPGRRAADRERRLARLAKANLVDTVFRPDAFCFEVIPIIYTASDGWNCRFSIADIRNSKLENRNSEKTPLRRSGAEFRFSSFDFPLPQSTIGNQKSAIGNAGGGEDCGAAPAVSCRSFWTAANAWGLVGSFSSPAWYWLRASALRPAAL